MPSAGSGGGVERRIFEVKILGFIQTFTLEYASVPSSILCITVLLMCFLVRQYYGWQTFFYFLSFLSFSSLIAYALSFSFPFFVSTSDFYQLCLFVFVHLSFLLVSLSVSSVDYFISCLWFCSFSFATASPYQQHYQLRSRLAAHLLDNNHHFISL